MNMPFILWAATIHSNPQEDAFQKKTKRLSKALRDEQSAIIPAIFVTKARRHFDYKYEPIFSSQSSQRFCIHYLLSVGTHLGDSNVGLFQTTFPDWKAEFLF